MTRPTSCARAFAVVAFGLACLHARVGAQSPPASPMAVDSASLDRRVNACEDFYRFACGGWMASHPIPPDQSRWGRFDELAERNRVTLSQILQREAQPRADRHPVAQRIGDYFAACMDVASVDRLGAAPLNAELASISRLASKAELPAVIARLHTIGVEAAFGFGSEQDFKDATRVLAIADQGGLTLPDRDYYLKQDPRSIEIRRQFQQHVERMFGLLGEASGSATASARVVFDMETALAQASMDLVARRDPENLYHLQTAGQLAGLTPDFSWVDYFRAIDAPPITAVNVVVPDFFKGFDALVASRSLDDWKVYLRWQLLSANAPLLSAPFVAESFAFNGKALQGQQEIRAREKRCVDSVDQDLGELLGQPYVEATFGTEGKQRMLEMVDALQRALDRDLRELAWMTPATRRQAIAKLAAMRNKIGYPDTWRDYTAVTIRRDDLVGNSWRAKTFEFARQLAKIGKPVDRGEWSITPPTVNAGYNPLMNDITFPAGILQPPFFFRDADDAVNFGAIGAVIGHEITHGFDDFGRQFDAVGNQRDWWTPEDASRFEARARCLEDQFSGLTAVDDVKLNGKLTLGENVADAGGVRLALMALLDRLQARPAQPIGDFTPQQRFFLGWAQIWCEQMRPETARLRAQVDPHAPGRYRVNAVLSNMPEFARAFGCRAPAPMVRADMCRVW